MTTKSSLVSTHKILMLFIAINIIGDIGNVAAWLASPASRMSLTPSIIGTSAGEQTALFVGSVILSIVAAVYIVSLFGLTKKLKWAPTLIIAISVVNRALALLLYSISPAFAFWAVWTVILVVLAYMDMRKMNVQTAKTP